MAHKRVRITGGKFCYPSILKITLKHPHSHENRQHNDSSIHKQDGGHSIRQARQPHPRTMGFLPNEIDHCYCRTPSRGTKRRGGPGVASVCGLEQLETGSSSVQRSEQFMGTIRGGPFCGSTEQSVKPVLQLETRSNGGSDRCIPTQLGPPESICVPTIYADRAVPSENLKRKGDISNNNTGMARPTLVPASATHGSCMSDFVTTDAGLTTVASERDTPPGTKRNFVISGVEGVRGRVASEGISEHAADLVVGSWRDGTKVAYNSAWSKWGSWCNPQQIDPFQVTVANVVNFLSNLHREGYEYSTIHSHRSAISSFHPVIDGVKIGQHPLVVKLLNFSTQIH